MIAAMCLALGLAHCPAVDVCAPLSSATETSAKVERLRATLCEIRTLIKERRDG